MKDARILIYKEIPSNMVALQSGISNRHFRTKGSTINGNVYIAALILVFILGFLTSKLNVIPTGRVIDKNVKNIPSDYLSDDDILVYSDKVILKINDAMVSNYESDSMEPFLGNGANGIVVNLKDEGDVNVGDIITFKKGNKMIVHRVIDKGKDDAGVYYITKGDNSNFIDEKLRLEEIEHKLIGIVY